MRKKKDALPKDIQQAKENFDKYDENIKSLTMDRMNKAPMEDIEPQTKLSTKEIDKSTDLYLKPIKRISSQERFNEKYREKYNFATEYVHFIAENKEIIGETIEIWTKPFSGMPAEFWQVPTNKPVWAPRHLAEQIKSRFYHRLVSQDATTGQDGMGKYYGTMVVDTTIPRLSAEPVTTRRSVFMGAS